MQAGLQVVPKPLKTGFLAPRPVYIVWKQHRHRPVFSCWQSDQQFCYPLPGKSIGYLCQCFNILASLSRYACTFKHYLDTNPKDRFSIIRACTCIVKFFLFDLILYAPVNNFQLHQDGSSWFELVLSKV